MVALKAGLMVLMMVVLMAGLWVDEKVLMSVVWKGELMAGMMVALMAAWTVVKWDKQMVVMSVVYWVVLLERR